MNWREFWNQDTPIYVSERHKALHYDWIARDIAALVPHADADVLDYGCGEALSAEKIAERCGRLRLCDAAPLVRERLRARHADKPRIAVLADNELAQLPNGSLDLVVANSVVQYLKLDELKAFLELVRPKLKRAGSLVVADVIPPDLGAVTDARALLAFAWHGGFLADAIIGLARAALSDYRRLRNELGLARYAEARMLAMLTDAGFRAERMERNIGHNAARMAFRARPSGDT